MTKNFERFWQEYPRKRNKFLAQKIWESEDLDNEAEKIICSISYFLKHDWRDREEIYIPYASTFLSQKRWLDIDHNDPAIQRAGKSEELKAAGWHFVPGSGWIPPARTRNTSIC